MKSHACWQDWVERLAKFGNAAASCSRENTIAATRFPKPPFVLGCKAELVRSIADIVPSPNDDDEDQDYWEWESRIDFVAFLVAVQ